MKPRSIFNFLFLFAVATMLWGCNFGCEVETVISDHLATQISSALQCTNTAQVQTDVQSVINVVKFCAVKQAFDDKQLKQGSIANVVCPLAASAAVTLLGSQIPANWQCNPALAEQGLISVVTNTCEKLPF